MKALKITIIFIIILALVSGGFYIINYIATSDTPIIHLNEIETYRKQFENDWENAGDWNEEIFSSHSDLVCQLSKDYEVSSLKDLNTSTAVEIVYENIFKRWNTVSCKKNEIDRYMNAISIIENSDANAKTNPNVIKIKEVYRVYNEAYKLVNRNIGLFVHFDGEVWNSYSRYANDIKSRCSNIKQNDIYILYLKNISEIKKGIESIPQKLLEGEKRFYRSLAIKIQESFSEIKRDERTREYLNKLRNLNTKFENEYQPDYRLKNFVKEFANDVYENENRDNEY